MSVKKLSEQVGGAVGGAVGAGAGSIVGMGVNALDEAIFGKKRRKNQIEQQQKLTDMQEASSKNLMDKQQKQQMEMWDRTNYGAQVAHMKQAGLNPAMMYGQAGEGVTGTTGASAGMGSASDEASQKKSSEGMMGMGIQGAMMQAQIENLKSVTEKNKADANLIKEKTTTETSQRDLLTENIKQNGIGRWLENVIEKAKISTPIPEGELEGERNNVFNESVWMQAGSYVQMELTNAVLKTEAEIGNIGAQKALTDKKIEGYYQELMNEIIKAKAAGKSAESGAVIAAAVKLSAEFETGEYTNWKTWTDLADKSINTINEVIGTVSPKGIIKGLKEGKE